MESLGSILEPPGWILERPGSIWEPPGPDFGPFRLDFVQSPEKALNPKIYEMRGISPVFTTNSVALILCQSHFVQSPEQAQNLKNSKNARDFPCFY